METQEKRKRRLLLALPVLIIPFLAFAFYALGGVKKEPAKTTESKGINTTLPDAKFKKDEPKDKFGFYAEAGNDTSGVNRNAIKDVADRFDFQGNEEDPQTQQINQKLKALNREINKPAHPASYPINSAPISQKGNIKSDVDRLEALMRTMQTPSENDPEMQQLGDMMEKILDIQHPERLREKYETRNTSIQDSQFRAIPAVIEGDQKVLNGSVIKLTLLDTLRLKGQIIPKGQLIFGAAIISNQRILLDIRNIRLGTSIVPVNLSVYSLDGMKGINAPSAVLKETAANGTDDLVRSIQLATLDQSIATQAVGAGLDAAKSLVSKKTKRIKVKLKAGQQVLLRNNESKSR